MGTHAPVVMCGRSVYSFAIAPRWATGTCADTACAHADCPRSPNARVTCPYCTMLQAITASRFDHERRRAGLRCYVGQQGSAKPAKVLWDCKGRRHTRRRDREESCEGGQVPG